MIIKLPTVPPTIANSLIVTERMIRSAQLYKIATLDWRLWNTQARTT